MVGNGSQSSLTNSGCIAGKTSPDDNRSTSLHKSLSMKVFLHCQGSHHPYQTFCRLEQVWQLGTECFFMCSNWEDIALCVDVKRFVVMTPGFAHPEIDGVLLMCVHTSPTRPPIPPKLCKNKIGHQLTVSTIMIPAAVDLPPPVSCKNKIGPQLTMSAIMIPVAVPPPPPRLCKNKMGHQLTMSAIMAPTAVDTSDPGELTDNLWNPDNSFLCDSISSTLEHSKGNYHTTWTKHTEINE